MTTHDIDFYRYPTGGSTELGPLRSAQEEVSEDRLDFGTLLTTLRRNMRNAIAIAVAVLAVTIIITAAQQRRFTATSQIVIDLQSARIAPTKDADGEPAIQSPSDQVDTEVKVLSSRELAQSVSDALDLQRNPYFNPELTPRRPGMLGRLRMALGLADAPRALDYERLRRSIVDQLIAGLQITRSGDSYAVDITASAATPRDAQAIANEYASQYTRSRVHSKLNDNRIALNFLSGKLDQLRGQAHSDMQLVQQYRVAHNLLSTSGASLTEQEISSYNQEVATARAQAAEDQARLNTARAQLRGGSSGDDVGEALGSGVVGTLRARQAEVSGRLAVLQSRYNDAHPDVQRARSELADVSSQIQAEIQRVISNLEAKSRVSGERLSSLSGSLSSAKGALAQNNRAMTDLDDLERRANASQSLYDSYLERYKQVAAQGGIEEPGAHLISSAELPLRPSSPNVELNLVLGTLLAIAAGIAGAFVSEWFFAGLTTGQEVETRLGVPCLASVPDLSRSLTRDDGAPKTAVLRNPRSVFTEAFRTLKTSLFNPLHPTRQIVAVTSSLPRDGKTTVATCLARTLAQAGETVVLVDGDRRQARVSRDLVGDHTAGLLECLSGKASLDDVLVKDRSTNLMILPLHDSAAEVDDVLGGEETARLFEELKQRFRYVIVDTPPVLAIAEARLLARLADAVLIVARWRRTPDHAIRATLRLLAQSGVRTTGAVLSQVDLKKQARFARGDSTYYHKHYAAYYS